MSETCTSCNSDKSPPESASSVGAIDAQVVYRIDKMDCPTEEALLRKALTALPGVDALQFNLMERILEVKHSLGDPAPIAAAIEALDMIPVRQDEADGTVTAAGRGIGPRQWWLMGASGILAIGAEVAAYISGQEMSWYVGVMALAAILIGGLGTLKKGWIALKTLSLNMNLLMTVAVIGAAVIGQWPEAAVVIWLFGLAEMIESLSLDRARNAIRGLLTLAPETAELLLPDGEWRETATTGIPIGARVRVRPGARIALDGVVESGQSAVNQAPITGESMPVEKRPGDPVFAGTINERGSFEFRVTSARGETMLDRIARSVQEAQGQRAPTQRFVDNFARIYTPIVFAIALLVALVPPLALGLPWYDWIYKALVLLVIACPCALVISTPVTVVSGLTAAARRGILVKGGLYLEQARHLKSVALDKTGTLTHGRPALTDVMPLGSFAREDALRIAAALDAPSEHPVATAIVGAFDGQPPVVADFEAITGRGVRGRVDGTAYWLGNHRLVEERGVCNPALEAMLETLEAEAKTVVVLMNEAQPLAVLAVADTVRATSREAVLKLKALGVEPVMLTGDNTRTAKAVAEQVGITEAHGDLLPEDKLAQIARLAQRGAVGMVGDGVNDAPALAKADIGFAMGAAGTDTAIETADVALMEDDLRKLPEFIELSVRTASVLWQNISFAIGVKAVFFVLTFTGFASLWLAILADMGASLLVVFNGMRLLGKR